MPDLGRTRTYVHACPELLLLPWICCFSCFCYRYTAAARASLRPPLLVRLLPRLTPAPVISDHPTLLCLLLLLPPLLLADATAAAR